MSARPMTARAMFILPLLIVGFSHITVTPLKEMFEVEPRLMYTAYAIAIIIGFVLLKKTRVVKDHEFHRANVMKSMKKVYEAEESGVWEREVPLDSTMTAEDQAKLAGDVSQIDRETPELELGNDAKVEVDFLLDSKHVINSNSRARGENGGGEGVSSTIGAVRQRSFMDRVLDGIIGLFKGNDAAKEREENRRAQLQAASLAAPVRASRPVAPIQASSGQDEQLTMTTMSDSGGHSTTISSSAKPLGGVSEQAQPAVQQPQKTAQQIEAEKVYAWDTPATSASAPAESLESMAMMGAGAPSSQSFGAPAAVQTGPRCKSCGASATSGERFCGNCGMDL